MNQKVKTLSSTISQSQVSSKDYETRSKALQESLEQFKKQNESNSAKLKELEGALGNKDQQIQRVQQRLKEQDEIVAKYHVVTAEAESSKRNTSKLEEEVKSLENKISELKGGNLGAKSEADQEIAKYKKTSR